MKMKLYQVRECTNCGDDDRYCESCVGASLAKARPSWDRAINRAAGIGLLLMAAEFVAGLLGNTWARSGVAFGAIMIGFWVGAASDALIAPFKSSKPKVAVKTLRCHGAVEIINIDEKTGLGTSKTLRALAGVTDRQCSVFATSKCVQDLCDAHCQLLCSTDCLNKRKS